MLPPGELRCICAVVRPIDDDRQQTTTDARDVKQYCPPTLCVGRPVKYYPDATLCSMYSIGRTLCSNLDEKRRDPDADEQRVAVESVEDVPLTVDLARVDLVEQSHHDERVEDDGEVLSWSLRLRRQRISTIVNVKQMLTCPHTTHLPSCVVNS